MSSNIHSSPHDITSIIFTGHWESFALHCKSKLLGSRIAHPYQMFSDGLWFDGGNSFENKMAIRTTASMTQPRITFRFSLYYANTCKNIRSEIMYTRLNIK